MEVLFNIDPVIVSNFIHACVCAMVGVVGAAFGSINQTITVKHLLWHMGLAAFVCGTLCYSKVAVWPTLHWYVCLLPSLFIGFGIFGIAVAMNKSTKSAESIDFVDAVKSWFNRGGNK